VLPRLVRDDRNFIALPVIRPERGPIRGESGLLRAMEIVLARHGVPQSRPSLREAISSGAEKLRPLLAQLADSITPHILTGEGEARRPLIVVPIDQAEELFGGEGAEEGQALLEIIRDLAKEDTPAIVAVFTIRSDSYDRLETARTLEGLRQQTMPLLPCRAVLTRR
jgi:hypothetical protein